MLRLRDASQPPADPVRLGVVRHHGRCEVRPSALGRSSRPKGEPMTTTPDPTRLCAECGHQKWHHLWWGLTITRCSECPCPEFKESE